MRRQQASISSRRYRYGFTWRCAGSVRSRTRPSGERLAPAGGDESGEVGREARVALRDARRELLEARVLAGRRRCAQLVEPRRDPFRRLRRLRARQAEALEVHEPGDARRAARPRRSSRRSRPCCGRRCARGPAGRTTSIIALEVGVVVGEPVAAGAAGAPAEAAPVDGEQRQRRRRWRRRRTGKSRPHPRNRAGNSTGSSESGPQRTRWCSRPRIATVACRPARAGR